MKKIIVIAALAVMSFVSFGAGTTAATQPWVKAQLIKAQKELLESRDFTNAVSLIVAASKSTPSFDTNARTNLMLVAENSTITNQIPDNSYWCLKRGTTNLWINASHSPLFEITASDESIFSSNVVFTARFVPSGETFHQYLTDNDTWLVSDEEESRKFRLTYQYGYDYNYNRCQYEE